MKSGTASRGAKSITVAFGRQDGRESMGEQRGDGEVRAGPRINVLRLQGGVPRQQIVGKAGWVPCGFQPGLEFDRGLLDFARNDGAVFPYDVAVGKTGEKAEVNR